MKHRIYLDHNATTPVDCRVLQAVVETLKKELGNPSSVHAAGREARQLIEKSRERIARFFGVSPREIIFTSGGTEAAHLLLCGVMTREPKGHLITSNVEHACVYHTAQLLEKRGYEVTFLPAGRWGAVQPEAVAAAIRPATRLITLMGVNNETGVKTDWRAVAQIAQDARIPFVLDGVALLGKEPFSLPIGVSGAFFSAHKIHGPKGVGVCVCRQTLKLAPLWQGGGQEGGRRAGTENIAGIVGLAEAITILENEQNAFTNHMNALRHRLEEGLFGQLPGVTVNGEGPRISNTVNLSFEGVDGEVLLMQLDAMEGIMVSHGSACSAGALEPSRVLLNMGISGRSSIRFSVGRTTTEQEVDTVIAAVTKIVKRLRI